ILVYGSYNHGATDEGTRELAGTRRRQERRLARQDRPGPARASQDERASAVVHASGRRGEWPAGPVDAKGILAGVKGIADTGFLVAFANRNDDHHEWAVRVAETVTEPLLTCEAVLAEASFHLGSVSVVLAMVRDGLVTLAFDCRDHLPQLAALAERYAARKPDLADLCLVR